MARELEDIGDLLPRMRVPLPAAEGSRLVELLARSECPALTTRRARRRERSGAPHDPIVWAAARGSNVVDTDGNVYVDLSSGFGAAAIGHRHPRVVEAVHRQADRLLHALGDLHPSDVKITLLERLAALAPFPDARVILGLGGADAVEAALKTAMLATGRPGVIAFEGGYHGLAHGPLAACGYADGFRAPFREQLNPHVTFVPWPARGSDAASALDAIDARWPSAPAGAVIVEPIQGRGGVRVPPTGFLAGLAERCAARGTLLIADEIFTAHGRTGARWQSDADGVTPDLICTGKALGGGLPVSACLGKAQPMEAWGDPAGAAIHTGTFFGNPLGCAAALATLDVIDEEGLIERSRALGETFRRSLDDAIGRHSLVREVRGRGLCIGIELHDGARSLAAVRGLLERGYIVLPAGCDAEVLQLVPPLDVDERLLDAFTEELVRVLDEVRL